MSGEPFYITTAIPYVNAAPHIGFAFEAVLTDALARWQRLCGGDVRFLTGTDENSLKNVRAAEAERVPTAELVQRNAMRFEALKGVLNLSFDDFIRTSHEERHLSGVRRLWEACTERGDIYKQHYSGLYCVGCERFYDDVELTDGRCPVHGTPPEHVEEENYFFQLSCYGEALTELIECGHLRIVPVHRANEVLHFIRAGLQDFSISRSQVRAHGWGVPVPGDPDQVMYVWFDALGNYITALGYGNDDPLYKRYWLENPDRVHVIGKDITRFHAIYWPAMLLSAGIPLPTTIFIHGFLTVDGQKIGKSLGNAIDPVALVNRYGADTVRYFLLRHVRPTEDGDFSQSRLVTAHNGELADQLGNLLSRTVSMMGRYVGGTIPEPSLTGDVDQRLIEAAELLRTNFREAMDDYAINEALAAIWQFVGAANQYVQHMAPWMVAKQRNDASSPQERATAENRLNTTLYNVAEALRLTAHYCAPFIPTTAGKIVHQLGTTIDDSGNWDTITRW
ncbi:MAG: methionine--tRNA ligase, partial [Acidiferrobacterales bacterium]